jgi:hypothetical protein
MIRKIGIKDEPSSMACTNVIGNTQFKNIAAMPVVKCNAFVSPNKINVVVHVILKSLPNLVTIYDVRAMKFAIRSLG